MSQDDNDLSDLKSRLGLNKDEAESDGDDASGQSGDADQGTAQQGGDGAGGEDGRHQAQQQGQAPGQGGPSQSGDQIGHNAETRVGPPPGEGGGPPGNQGGGPPGQGGPGVGNQGSAPQGGPGVGNHSSSPQGGPGLGDQPSNSFGETTPDDDAPGPESFGPPGDHDSNAATPGPGSGFSQSGSASEPIGDPGADVDLGGDEDFGLDESTFSTPVYVMLGVVLVIGLVFGLLIRSSLYQRSIYSMQTEQAKQVLDAVEPKAKAFDQAKNIIQGLDSEKVEYDKVKKLGELNVAVDMSVISTNRLFLGGDRMAMLTSYIVKAQKLQNLIQEHDRLTNKADKKELEKIVGSAEEQAKKDVTYAAAFNFSRYKNAITSKNYKPSTGKLITIPDMEDIKDGKVKYTLPNSSRGGRIDIRGVIPISKGDMLTVGGENAFGRYQHRIKKLKHLVEKMSGRSKALVQKLKELAERPGPPLISL
ncbi:MAG: hypothetical protein ABEK29_09125 [Bradymonadaceae bacterium]